MNADSLSRRLAALEDAPEQDMVLVVLQWLNEDGTPAGEMIERWTPRSCIFKFLWYDQVHEPPAPGVTRIKLKWLDEERL